MNRKPFRRVLAASLIAGMAGLAAPLSAPAQIVDDNRPTEPPKDAPLGGPSVRDRAVPGTSGSFGDDTDGQKRRLANRIPPRVMRQALGVIMSQDAPENIRATPEQREKIQALGKEFEQQLRTYIQDHRKELEELRGKIPPGAMAGPAGEIFRRLDADGPDADRGPRAGRRGPGSEGAPGPAAGRPRRAGADEIPEDVRQRLREIAAGMPPFDQVYTKVWSELRPEQQKAVDARLDEFRRDQARQREDMYVDRQLGQRRGQPGRAGEGVPPPPRRRPADGARINAPDQPGPGAGGRQAPPDAVERHERLMRIFKRMTPEQQEQLLARLEARMREQGAGAPGPRPQRDRPPRPARGEPRPAPRPGDIPVPPMDEMDAPPPPPAPPRD